MSPDGTTLLDSGAVVYTGPTAEGTKIFKLNGYYYISIPEGGVSRGWQSDNTCSYSLDGKTWQPFGSTFETRFGYWKGTRVGMFSFNTDREGGTAAFDWFHYDYDGPK